MIISNKKFRSDTVNGECSVVRIILKTLWMQAASWLNILFAHPCDRLEKSKQLSYSAHQMHKKNSPVISLARHLANVHYCFLALYDFFCPFVGYNEYQPTPYLRLAIRPLANIKVLYLGKYSIPVTLYYELNQFQ